MSATADQNGMVPIIDRKSSKQPKKRKRVRPSPEDQHQIEVADRFNKLVHACSKHLHKDAKIVKSFECQKIVRSIKSAKEISSEDAGKCNNIDGASDATNMEPKSLTRLKTLEKKLERTKKLDLEALVQVGLKRLGVLSLDPRVDEEFILDEGDNHETFGKQRKEARSQNLDAKALSQCDDPFYQALIESMLQHKRLSASLDQLNEKVTEFREWKVSREGMLPGETNTIDDAGGSMKRKKKKQEINSSGNSTMVVAGGFQSRKRGLDLGGDEGASGLFIGSLAGLPAEAYTDDGEYDMGGSDDDDRNMDGYQEEMKKNRPGQRARRAKATAIEARKSGKTWVSSLNWREKKSGRVDVKSRDGGHDHKSRPSDSGSVKPTAAQHIATMGKTWKEEGNAHPSWAAKAAQKSQGIAKFEGTKITFD